MSYEDGYALNDLMPADEVHPQLISPRMKRTSKATYAAILAEGLLSRQRRRVYELLFTKGPLTGREVNEFLKSPSGHKRLSELQRLDVVDIYGTKDCAVTNRQVEAWDVTGRMPLEKDHAIPVTPKAQLLRAVSKNARLAKALRLRPTVRRRPRERAEAFMGRYLKWERDHVDPIADDIEEESDAEDNG